MHRRRLSNRASSRPCHGTNDLRSAVNCPGRSSRADATRLARQGQSFESRRASAMGPHQSGGTCIVEVEHGTQERRIESRPFFRRDSRINDDPRAASIHSSPLTAGKVIRQRRSALAFDGKTSISAGRFFTMLARVMPQVERDLCNRPMPWDVLPWAPAIHLVLFIHRVDGLVPGLYMLVRDPMKIESLTQSIRPQFVCCTAGLSHRLTSFSSAGG